MIVGYEGLTTISVPKGAGYLTFEAQAREEGEAQTTSLHGKLSVKEKYNQQTDDF